MTLFTKYIYQFIIFIIMYIFNLSYTGSQKQSTLEYIIKKVNEKNFHIHDITIGQILLNNNDGTIWICGHC